MKNRWWHNSFWLDKFGNVSVYTAVISNILISVLLSNVAYYLIFKIDKLLHTVLVELFTYDVLLFQHSCSTVINIAICTMFIDLAIRSHQEDRGKHQFIYVLILSFCIFSSFATLVSITLGRATSVPMQIFFTIAIGGLISEFLRKCSKLSDAFDTVIDKKILDAMEDNMQNRGYNILLNRTDLETDPINTSITVHCSRRSFDNIHKLLQKYCENGNTSKFLLQFLIDTRIKIDDNCNFIDANNNTLSTKDFLKKYHEYVIDFQNLNSNKPNNNFLNA